MTICDTWRKIQQIIERRLVGMSDAIEVNHERRNRIRLYQQMLTASKLALAQKCAHWFGFDDPDQPQTPQSRFGTEVHQITERALLGYPVPASKAGDYARQALLALSDNMIAHPIPEITLGYSPMLNEAWVSQTCRACDGVNALDMERKKRTALESERAGFYGTADVIARRGPHPVIIDWKTGEYQSAQNNAQLMHLATALGRLDLSLLGLPSEPDVVEVAIVKLDRYGHSISWSTITRAHMDAHRNWLRDIWTGEFDDSPNPGPHCAYCPHAPSCGGPYRSDEAVTLSDLYRERSRIYARINALEADLPEKQARDERKTKLRILNNTQWGIIATHMSAQEAAMSITHEYDTREVSKKIGTERAYQIFDALKKAED